jgi:ribokinase
MLPDDVKVTFDPGMLYSRLGLKELKNILKRTFVLFLNLKEIKLLTGVEDYKKGIKILHEEGVDIIVVKLDKKGCYVDNGRLNYSIKSFKVDVIDTTGAGDAFCAGFIFGLVSGKNLYESGRLGNFVASRCIRKMGARFGLPYLKELEFIY